MGFPIQGIDHAAINVRNLDASLKFYTDVLGLNVTEREPSKPGIEYFLDCGHSLIGLIQGDEKEPAHPLKDGGLGGNHVSFRVKAQDFDQVVRKLQHENIPVRFVKKRENSWSVYFEDIDGNKLEMTAWPKEDGIKA